MFHKRYHVCFWIYFFINYVSLSLCNEVKKDTVCHIVLSSETYLQDIERWLSEPVVIEQVIFESDVHMREDEFRYVVDLDDHAVLTAGRLKVAISNLKKKNKFQTITLSLRSTAQGGTYLVIHAEGLWTFKKIVFHGPMIGKDTLRQYCSFEPSEPFDIQKHLHFIHAVKQALEDEGYCDPVVADYLEYDCATKSVTVHCVLDQREAFLIGTVDIIVKDTSKAQEHYVILEKIKKKFCDRLSHSHYTCQQIERVQQQIKEYVINKGFLNASVVLKKEIDKSNCLVNLTFEIDLGQKRLFSFVGNSFFSTKTLLDHLSAFEGSLYELPMSMLCEELVDLYKKHGFFHGAITANQRGDHLYFTITEGTRVSIEHSCLQGINSFDKDMLLKKFFASTTKPTCFDADAFKHALDAMILWYVHEGFWDCKLLQQELVFDKDSGTYLMKVVIDEGRRRYLTSLTIEGFPDLVHEGPFQDIHAKLPMPFDKEILHEQRLWLIAHFQQQGYLYVQAKPVLQEDVHDKNKFSLAWVLDLTNGPVKFGKTIVTGSCSFPIKNILRQLHYKRGDIWDKHKLEQSVLDLRRLGIFESVYMHPDALGQPEAEKSIMVSLAEDDPFEVRVRVGFQQVSKNLTFRSGSTYKVGGSFLYKNVSNNADFIRIDGDLTRFYRYLSGQYFCPWIFELPVNMVLKGYSNKYTQPVKIGIDKPLYRATQEGGLLGLTYPLGRSKVGTNVGLEFMETSGLSRDLARAINFEPTLIDRKVPYIFVEPTIFIDLLDDKLNPTRGSLTIVSFKGMFSWEKESVNFFKIMAEQSFFVPINAVVFGVRFRFGHIFNQQLSSIMPLERFYLGGPYSLRGYEIDQAPPLGLYVDEHGKSHLVSQGGKSMINGNLEVRIPVYDRIGGAIFQDFGMLIEHSFAEIAGNKLLAATGFGVRYTTPIGPLRFDIGWKWRRQRPEQAAYVWFLTLGNAF